MESRNTVSAKKRNDRKVWIILIIGLVIEILFDPLSSLAGLSESLEARVGLPLARARWNSQGIVHYKFDIRGSVPLVCMFGGNVEVRDDTVIHTGQRSDAQLAPGFKDVKFPPICNHRIYTMPLLFDEIERWLRESPSSVSRISFDLKYGFVSGFYFGSSGGWGLLSPAISDCCGGFRIENFQVLDKEASD